MPAASTAEYPDSDAPNIGQLECRTLPELSAWNALRRMGDAITLAKLIAPAKLAQLANAALSGNAL